MNEEAPAVRPVAATRSRGRLSNLLCALGATLAIAGAPGCAFRGSLEHAAVAFNEAAAETANQVMLLNVLRGMDRRPLVYTEFTKITGSISGTVEVGSSFPFGGAAPSLFAANPLARVVSGPTFDVRVLGSKEFVQGIRQPISADLYEYYWKQGFDPRLLTLLLVRQICEGGKKPNECPTRYSNYPPSKERFEAFVRKVTEILGETGSCDVEIQPLEPDAARRIPASVEPTTALEALAKGADLKEARDGPSYALVPPSGRQFVLKCNGVTYELLGSMKDQGSTGAATLVFRSPEAVIYYLGQIARTTEDSPHALVPMIERDGNPAVPLFEVSRVSLWKQIEARFRARPPEVAVRYRGDSYAIPWAERGKRNASMTAFAIITQLLAIHSARSEAPTSQSETISVLPIPR